MYALFYGDVYYPEGGARDFRGWFPTIHDAMVAWELVDNRKFMWGHVANDQMRIVVDFKEPRF